MRTPLFVASFLFVGCGSPFFLEAKAVAVCQHLPAQRFQVPQQLAALPPAMQHGLSLERTFDFDVTAQVPPEFQEMMDTHFGLTSVQLSVVNPSDNLGFIDEAHLQLEPGAASGLERRTFNYWRSETTPRAVSWNGQAFDVAEYLQSGNLKYTVALVGSLPPGDVVVDIDACAEVAVKLNY